MAGIKISPGVHAFGQHRAPGSSTAGLLITPFLKSPCGSSCVMLNRRFLAVKHPSDFLPGDSRNDKFEDSKKCVTLAGALLDIIIF